MSNSHLMPYLIIDQIDPPLSQFTQPHLHTHSKHIHIHSTFNK